MGQKKLVNEFFWISYILFFGMYQTRYKNFRIGFQAYFKNIPWKSWQFKRNIYYIIMRKLSLDNDLDETIWIEIRNILTIIQQRVS
jgi:hypothetical protein